MVELSVDWSNKTSKTKLMSYKIVKFLWVMMKTGTLLSSRPFLISLISQKFKIGQLIRH
jgi:hypothetical protein